MHRNATSRFALAAGFSLALLAGAARAQTLGCAVGAGNGGPIPATGTGGGTYPTVLPSAPSSFALNVASLPPGASVVTEVRARGLTHTWVSDLQFVLEDPSGALHNVFVRAGGFSCDFNGDYVFIPSCTGPALALPVTCTGSATLTAGTYDQNFGSGTLAWPTGTSGINNTRLDSIAATTGTWTLRVYDWAGGDIGALTSFDLCFGTPAGPAVPSSAPTLLTPSNGAIATNPVTFTWSSVDCAASYDIDIDGVVTNVPGTSFAAPVAAGPHTWTVRAANSSGAGPFAAPFTFQSSQPPPSSVCFANGAAVGPVPASGSGGSGSVWPSVLPDFPYSTSYIVTAPLGATQLVKVDFNFGTQHTWAGDLFFVLTDPTGAQHNLLHRLGSSNGSVGLNCDMIGPYSIYESFGLPWPTACPPSTDIPSDNYTQSFGAWPSGLHGIFNTPLSAIPVSNGLWTLTIYDWSGGDTGVLGGWRLCFDDGPPVGPMNYCTAGTSTSGCNATMGASGNPSASQTTPCVLTVSQVEGQQNGILFYGLDNAAFTPTPWGSGTSWQCVRKPTQRTGAQTSGGSAGACDGVLTLDWDAWQLAVPNRPGSPWGSGDKVYVQAWFRDPPAPRSSNLSDAIELTYLP